MDSKIVVLKDNNLLTYHRNLHIYIYIYSCSQRKFEYVQYRNLLCVLHEILQHFDIYVRDDQNQDIHVVLLFGIDIWKESL